MHAYTDGLNKSLESNEAKNISITLFDFIYLQNFSFSVMSTTGDDIHIHLFPGQNSECTKIHTFEISRLTCLPH